MRVHHETAIAKRGASVAFHTGRCDFVFLHVRCDVPRSGPVLKRIFTEAWIMFRGLTGGGWYGNGNLNSVPNATRKTELKTNHQRRGPG